MNKEIRPVSGVSDPKAVERLNDANSRRAADRQNLTKGAERAKPATPVSRDGSTLEQFGAQVPLEFSSSPQKMQTEWGWRRFIVQTLNEEQSTVAQGMQQQETTAANGNGELTQKMVQTLWQTLQPLLQESALQGQEIPVANWMIPGMLLPLSYLEEQHVNDPKVPEKVKRMAIAEKLQVAVQSPSLPIVGGGLFYPPIQVFEERRQAVYFEAERQHVMSADGQHAQHLLIKPLSAPGIGGDANQYFLAKCPFGVFRDADLLFNGTHQSFIRIDFIPCDRIFEFIPVSLSHSPGRQTQAPLPPPHRVPSESHDPLPTSLRHPPVPDFRIRSPGTPWRCG